MRCFVGLCVLAVATTSAASARPDDQPTDDWHSAFQKQQAELDALKAALEREQEEREQSLVPQVRLSGFVQVDWVVHNQMSQDEVNGSTGAPLNEDRFKVRRGHLRVDAEKSIVLGAIEIDANTVNGPQVRPIEAQV